MTSSSCVFGHKVLKDHVFPTQPVVVDCTGGLQLVFSVVLLQVQEDLKEQHKKVSIPQEANDIDVYQ
jgi:hypothetical protein